MNYLDYIVLFGTLLGIAGYGVWRTRGRRDLNVYLHGDPRTRWIVIGLSVMATQASAITFLSMPGQAYQDGLKFIQIYFGLPFALIIISAFFLPIYRRLNVNTAYEYLGMRFDTKTRLLGAGLFLLQRGLSAGITIYAPAIVLSTVFGWPLNATIVCCGALVLVYTVSGGNDAINVTQKYQIAVIFFGMMAALIILIWRIGAHTGVGGAMTVAGGLGKLNAIDFSFNPRERYTIWSGVFGGIFLSLSYFGADQSQVQRYLSGTSLRESRLGLMFNALFKIPMQLLILMLGVMLLVFYQFERPPVFFNQNAWNRGTEVAAERLDTIERDFTAAHADKREAIQEWLAARRGGDEQAATAGRSAVLAAHARTELARKQVMDTLQEVDAGIKTNDADYVFITFILNFLPHGLIGLLIAVFFSAALSSLSAELSALGETTTVDWYKHVIKTDGSDSHYVGASRAFTLLWGLIAVGFALFASHVENLIQAINIVGSLFYGVPLALLLAALFLKRIGGNAIFYSALAAQALVLYFYYFRDIGFLWFNLIGCIACLLFAALTQAALNFGTRAGKAH